MKLREILDLSLLYRWWFEDAIRQAIAGSAEEQRLWMRWTPIEGENAHLFVNEHGEKFKVTITVEGQES